MINAGNMQMDMALNTPPLAINRILAEARDLFGFKTDYEDVQLQRLPEVLKDARRFVDVGANRGLYSYVANAILADSEIVAVEADPNLSHRLQEAMKTWPNPNRNRLRVLACAAGDVAATLPFTVGLEDTLGSFTRSDYDVGGSEIVNVPVRPLDEAVTPQRRTVFKIDIEGFEYRALVGAMTHLSQPDCILVLELHAWGDAAINKYPHHVLGFLRQRGFSVERFGEAHQFMCRRADPAGSWLGYLKNAPKFRAKHLLRQAGVRELIYRITGRSEASALRQRSGVKH